jgi:hypothetical protein
MKKALGILSVIYLIFIPFSTVFYLLYSLFSNKSVNLLNGGIVLGVTENSCTLSMGSHVILIYIVVYLLLVGLLFISSKTKLGKKFYEKENKLNG